MCFYLFFFSCSTQLCVKLLHDLITQKQLTKLKDTQINQVLQLCSSTNKQIENQSQDIFRLLQLNHAVNSNSSSNEKQMIIPSKIQKVSIFMYFHKVFLSDN